MLTVTIEGPQGSGKTRLSLMFARIFEAMGVNVRLVDEGVPIDDLPTPEVICATATIRGPVTITTGTDDPAADWEGMLAPLLARSPFVSDEALDILGLPHKLANYHLLGLWLTARGWEKYTSRLVYSRHPVVMWGRCAPASGADHA